jgi:hypothetical protein
MLTVGAVESVRAIGFTEIVRTGDAIPGQPAGTNFGAFESTNRRLAPVITQSGRVVFIGTPAGQNATGLYSGIGGAPIAVTDFARAADKVRSATALAAGGDAVGLFGLNVSQKAMFLVDPFTAGAPVTIVARSNTLVDGSPVGSGGLTDGGIDALGNIAFGGTDGVYRKNFGQAITKLRPGPISGLLYDNVNIGDGRAAWSELTINNGPENDVNLLRQTSGNALLTSVHTGMTIPGTTDTWMPTEDAFPQPFRSTPLSIDNGFLYFNAGRWTNFSSPEHEGIYRVTMRPAASSASTDTVQTLVRAGQPVPGVPGRTFSGFSGFSADAGAVVFIGSYGAGQTGLFGISGTFVFPILLPGTTVPSDTGDATVTAATRLGRDALQGGAFAAVVRLDGTPAVYKVDLGPGGSQASAVLPSSIAGDAYNFALELGDSGAGVDFPIWLDPPATNGYDFVTDGAHFESLTLPVGFNLDGDGAEQPFTIEFDGMSVQVLGGQTLLFTDTRVGGVDAFSIRGIMDQAFETSPTIATGLTFVAGEDGQVGQLTVTQTAVPEPAAALLLGSAMVALWGRRRRDGSCGDRCDD